MTRTSTSSVFALMIALFGSTALAGQRDGVPVSDPTVFDVTIDQDGSCGGGISARLGYPGRILQMDGVNADSGGAWAIFPSASGIRLLHVADVGGGGPFQGRLAGVIPVTGAFRPQSLRVGAVAAPAGFAIDIGTSESLSFQDGDEILIYAFDGAAFRLLERQPIPPGTSAITFSDLLVSSYSWKDAAPGSASCLLR